jgi:hypothetical protein
MVNGVPITWEASGGSISTEGAYTAGETPGRYHVIATRQGGTEADTAIVNLSTSAPTLLQLVLNPATFTLAPGETTQFTVTGSWSDGSTTVPAATYAATGGTITPGGLYTAGAAAGSYRVIATQQAGGNADTSIVIVSAPPPLSCARTVAVSTFSGLTSALSQALPGDCILLSPGTYSLTASITIARSGTPSLPIVVQGSGSNTIIDVTQRLMFVDASYFQLRRLRLTNFGRTGLWLRGVTGVVIDSVEVDHTLHEAVAIKNGSNHNVIQNSIFHDTGIEAPEYGEGVYIGGSGNPGYPLDFGVTDNQLLNNHFGPNVRAEGVDLKEGADRTLIRGNFFDGTGTVFGSGALIGVIANGVIIDSNFMQYGSPQVVAFRMPVTRVMTGNLATRNTIDLEDQFRAQRGTAIPYGFQFQVGTVDPIGAVIACNNVMLNGLLSNRPCTP